MGKKTKLGLKLFGAAIASTIVGFGIGGYASFIAGMKNSEKAKQKAIKKTEEVDNNEFDLEWFKDKKPETIKMLSDDGLQLEASFIRQPQPNGRTVILAHGYHHARRQMIPYAKIFYNLGYNVLMPDARSHGESEGSLIGFGWLDRRDYIRWVQRAVLLTQPSEKIVLLGISMGAATVIATSGEDDLPKNVKAVIEDSSFSQLDDQFRYRIASHYHLPARELEPIVSYLTKLEGGYSFKEANIAEQIAKTKVPILFIHGDQDDYVPIEMLDELVEAANVPCEVYIAEGAGHVQSIVVDPERYQKEISNFLQKYVD